MQLKNRMLMMTNYTKIVTKTYNSLSYILLLGAFTRQELSWCNCYNSQLWLSLVLICRRPTWDIAAGTAWDNCGICEHLSPAHNLTQALTTDLPAKLC